MLAWSFGLGLLGFSCLALFFSAPVSSQEHARPNQQHTLPSCSAR